jgi:hypothetical protein
MTVRVSESQETEGSGPEPKTKPKLLTGIDGKVIRWVRISHLLAYSTHWYLAPL